MNITGSESYAEVAIDLWRPSKKLSDDLRPLLPNTRELLDEIRRYMPSGVELMSNANHGRFFAIGGENYTREKFYVRVLLENEYVVGKSTDHVRRACFDGAKLVGNHIARHVVALREKVAAPIAVRFTAEPMMLPCSSHVSDDFAALDLTTDRVAIHFMTYFVVTPAGDPDQETIQ